MNGIRNNVVFCGFNDIEKNSFWLTDIRDIDWEQGVYYDDISKRLKHRFPYVVYVDSIEEALKHQGFAIFLKVEYDEIANKTKREIDMYYRSTFYKYDCIYLYNEQFLEKKLNNFSNITFIGEELMCGELDDFVNHEYFYYLKNKESEDKVQSKIISNIYNVKKYLKKNKTAKSREIAREFNISERTVQRYMKILNNLENCVGCDYYKNEWYYISAQNRFSS